MERMSMGVLMGGALLLAMVSAAPAAPVAPRAAEVSTPPAAVADDEGVPSVHSRQASGVIASVDREAKTVTIKARGGQDRTFALSPRVQIKLGKVKATFAELQPGKRVFIRYRDVEGAAIATTVKVL